MQAISSAPLALALTTLVTSSMHAETLDELYAKAKAEGALHIYGGGPARLYEGWIKEYEASFPGIKVTLTGGYEALDPRFRDGEGAFTPIGVFAIAPAYNTKLVAAEDAPRSPLDFLKPMFRGKLITAYPHDDDATLYAFHTIVKKHGWKYMDDYMATEPRFIQGHLGVVRSVASGESIATFDMMLHHTMVEKGEGKPIEVAFPASDPLPIWGQLGAILKDGPHPNAAKLWLQWYMGKEPQARIGTWSARNDVAPPFGLKPILDYNVANDLAEIVTQPALLAELRKRFASYTGDVKNKGGTR